MRFVPASLAIALGCSSAQDRRPTETGVPGDTGADPACSQPDVPTWESWGEAFFVTWCQSCHSRTSPRRAGAPEGVDFDSEADVRASAADIRRTVLDFGTMPVGGGLDATDRDSLDLLLRCGP